MLFLVFLETTLLIYIHLKERGVRGRLRQRQGRGGRRGRGRRGRAGGLRGGAGRPRDAPRGRDGRGRARRGARRLGRGGVKLAKFLNICRHSSVNFWPSPAREYK